MPWIIPITTPSAFPGDPEGYLGNQCAHFAIGLALTVLLLPAWGTPSALIVGVLYGIVWEGLVQRWVLPWDSFEDSIHVTTGGTVIAEALAGGRPGVEVVLIFWVALLTIGVRRRL